MFKRVAVGQHEASYTFGVVYRDELSEGSTRVARDYRDVLEIESRHKVVDEPRDAWRRKVGVLGHGLRMPPSGRVGTMQRKWAERGR